MPILVCLFIQEDYGEDVIQECIAFFYGEENDKEKF